MINIGIVDDHPMVRSSLRYFLSDHVDLRVIGEAASCREAMELLGTMPELDVLVMDLAMPGQSGTEALCMIRARAPELGVLILSGFAEEHYATALIRKGAGGYLNKACEPMEIVHAIRAIAAGRRYISGSVGELLAQQLDMPANRAPHEQLSRRELEVFMKLANGERPGAVAAALLLSVKTVSTYRTRLLEKLSLKSNSDLTYYAVKNNLIT